MTDSFGGLLSVIYLSSGSKDLYWSGLRLIKNLNLSRSPYFSLIGNLGNSWGSLLISITPECWPKAKSKFLEIKSLIVLLYSPNGYEKKLGYSLSSD